ncbi:hypothetical protein LINPERHAP2_LOCUS40917 [Linum perenne]
MIEVTLLKRFQPMWVTAILELK